MPRGPGAIQRSQGGSEQLVGRRSVGGEAGDTRRNRHGVPAHGSEGIDRPEDPVGDYDAAAPGRDDDELVPPDPGHGVDHADLIGQHGGDRPQDGIPGGNTSLLVSGPESVHVEDRHRDLSLLAVGAGDLQLQHAVERPAVGEPGQRIEMGQPLLPVSLLDGSGGRRGAIDGDGHEIDERIQNAWGAFAAGLAGTPAEGQDAEHPRDSGLAHHERDGQDTLQPVVGGERAGRCLVDRRGRDGPSLEDGGGEGIHRGAAAQRRASHLVGRKRRRAGQPQGADEPVVTGGRHDCGRGAPVGEGGRQQRLESRVEISGARDGAGGGSQDGAGVLGMVGLGHVSLSRAAAGMGGPGRDAWMIRAPRRDARAAPPILGPVKLVVAIVNPEDAGPLVDLLLEREFRATRLHSSGGFLKQSNATVLLGVDDEEVEEVIGLIRASCHARTQLVNPMPPILEPGEFFLPYPLEVEVGGATVFVLPVERFERL